MLLPAPAMPTFAKTYGGIHRDLERRTLGWVVLFSLMLLSIGKDDRPSYGVVGEAALAKAIERSEV